MECKEKADQKQALAWLRENSNPDARPGRKRHKKCLLGTKKKRKKNPKKPLKPQKPQFKKGVGQLHKRRGNSCITQVASFTSDSEEQGLPKIRMMFHSIYLRRL